MTTIVMDRETADMYADTRCTIDSDAQRNNFKIVPCGGLLTYKDKPIVSIGVAGHSIPTIDLLIHSGVGDIIHNINSLVKIGPLTTDVIVVFLFITKTEEGYESNTITLDESGLKEYTMGAGSGIWGAGTGFKYTEILQQRYGCTAEEAMGFVIDTEIDHNSGGFITNIKPDCKEIFVYSKEATHYLAFTARNKVHEYFMS